MKFKKGDLVISKIDNRITQVGQSYFVDNPNWCGICELNFTCKDKGNKERIRTGTTNWGWKYDSCAARFDKATKQEEFLYTLGIIKKRGEDVN